MKKKRYNPLTMFGSYIGALIGFVIPFPVFFTMVNSLQLVILSTKMGLNGPRLFFIILPIVIGFFIGYFIHGILRAVKK